MLHDASQAVGDVDLHGPGGEQRFQPAPCCLSFRSSYTGAMSMLLEHTVLPPAAGSTLPDLSAALEEASSSSLVGPDGAQIALPDEVFEVLRDAVRAMAQGQAITLAPHDTVMTTQGAAEFLGISRPTLVRLLTAGEIPFTQPNRHRRVRLSDLVEYQARSRHARREILADLSRDATADGASGGGFEATR